MTLIKYVPIDAHSLLCSFFQTDGSLLCDCGVLMGHREVCDKENFYGRGGKVLLKGKE
jgi:hypothetical protein